MKRFLFTLAVLLLAVTLPWLEVVVGLMLVTGFWRREAATVTAGLLVVFVVAVSLALLRGIDIENCGCFSVSGTGLAGRRAGEVPLQWRQSRPFNTTCGV